MGWDNVYFHLLETIKAVAPSVVAIYVAKVAFHRDVTSKVMEQRYNQKRDILLTFYSLMAELLDYVKFGALDEDYTPEMLLSRTRTHGHLSLLVLDDEEYRGALNRFINAAGKLINEKVPSSELKTYLKKINQDNKLIRSKIAGELRINTDM